MDTQPTQCVISNLCTSHVHSEWKRIPHLFAISLITNWVSGLPNCCGVEWPDKTTSLSFNMIQQRVCRQMKGRCVPRPHRLYNFALIFFGSTPIFHSLSLNTSNMVRCRSESLGRTKNRSYIEYAIPHADFRPCRLHDSHESSWLNGWAVFWPPLIEISMTRFSNWECPYFNPHPNAQDHNSVKFKARRMVGWARKWHILENPDIVRLFERMGHVSGDSTQMNWCWWCRTFRSYLHYSGNCSTLTNFAVAVIII